MHKETTNRELKDGCAINNDGKDENNSTRYLWIWIHVVAFDDAFNKLQSTFQRQVTYILSYSMGKTGNLLLDIEVKCTFCRCKFQHLKDENKMTLRHKAIASYMISIASYTLYHRSRDYKEFSLCSIKKHSKESIRASLNLNS